MILQSLSLQNFRGFKKKSLEFSSGLTVIAGPNTAGKTNLLEAIYLLAAGKSFKAEREAEMIGYGEELARVKCQILPIHTNTTNKSIDLETILTIGQVGNQSAPLKKYLVNDVARRQIDFIGNLRAVLFWPEDLEIITDSPGLRRKYLDMVLTQVDGEYRRSLMAYEKGIRQRNRLLERIRDENANPAQLTFWNQLLIKNGNVLTEKRQEYIEFVNNSASIAPMGIGAPSAFYQIDYDKSLISESRLEQYKNEEVASGMTLVGPQRDDIKFQILPIHTNTTNIPIARDLSLYGSRGEQRLGILWLKLAELEFIAQATAEGSIFQQTGERPILLLDDIFSELDEAHRQLVLEIIPNQQTIMTTTDLGLMDDKFLKSAKIIRL